MTIKNCKIIELPEIIDSRGNLCVVEGARDIPFKIERIYFLHSVPMGADRGGHAHKRLHQLFIAPSGSFDVILSDGNVTQTYRLDSPNKALYVTPKMWRDVKNFSSGAVCMVLASEYYDEDEYIRNYAEFLSYIKI